MTMPLPQQPAVYNSGVGYPVNDVTDGNLTLVDVYGTGAYGNLIARSVSAALLQGLAPSGDTTGAADAVIIQILLNAAAASGTPTITLAPGVFYVNTPLLIPPGVTLRGAGPATQSGDATNQAWQSVIKPVTPWSNTYKGVTLPTYTGFAATASAMNGTTASGFTGTYVIQDVPYMLDGYPASGTVTVPTSTGQSAVMTYTGLTATMTVSGGVLTVTNQLTGCSVTNTPTGTFHTAAVVTSASMAYGQGGVVCMIDMVSLGAANPKVPRAGVVDVWFDCSASPAGVDGIFSWGQVTAFSVLGVGMNAPAGNGIGAYQNSAFGVGLSVGSNEPDGWNVRDVVIEKGQYHGCFGFLQDSTLINVHPQQNGQSGVTGDGFVIMWSHNLLTGCRADLNFNGFTILDQGGMGASQYWAATELNGCTTQRNKRRGLQRFNTGADGQTQQSPTKAVDCCFEGDGTGGTYEAMLIAGRNVVDLSGTSVHCYELDTATGAPAYALCMAGQGTGPGYPGVLHWKGGFANAAAALLNPAGGSAYLTDIDISAYGAGAYFNQSATPPYTYRTHQTASVTATYTARPQDEYVICNATTAAFTVTLPNSAGLAQTGTSGHTAPATAGYDPLPTGKRIGVVKTDSTAHAVTIAAAGTDQVNGMASVQLQSQWQRCELVWNGSAWNVVSGSVAAPQASFNPSDPTGTTSTTPVMMGLGGTVSYTPVSTGSVRVTAVCYAPQTAASTTVSPRWGTGAAPGNGAAAAGTSWAGSPAVKSGAASAAVFAKVLTLTAGTPTWFDFAVATSNAADTATITDCQFTFEEVA